MTVGLSKLVIAFGYIEYYELWNVHIMIDENLPRCHRPRPSRYYIADPAM